MRHITTWLALSTLVFAVTTAYLYWQLASAHERNQRALVNETTLHSDVERLEQIRTGLEVALRAARHAPSSQAQDENTVTPAISSRAPAAMTSTSMPSAPEMTNDQRQWITRRKYQRIFRELGLSPAEVDVALTVLVQQDLRAKKAGTHGVVAPPEELAQREQAELAAVLGSDKAQRFAAQKKLLPLRSEIKMLRMRLEDTEHPLSADQQDLLLKILASRPSIAPTKIEAEDQQQSQERMNAWMRERDERLLKDTAPVLTLEQRQLLEEDAKFQNAMRARVSFIGPAPGTMPTTAAAGSSAPPSNGQ